MNPCGLVWALVGKRGPRRDGRSQEVRHFQWLERRRRLTEVSSLSVIAELIKLQAGTGTQIFWSVSGTTERSATPTLADECALSHAGAGRVCDASAWCWRGLLSFPLFPTGLDYKKLTEEGASPLDALQPVLSSQNILSISKLVPRIPGQDGRMLSPSSLYTLWLQKLFWTGDPQLIKEAPASPPEWLRAFEVCTKYLDRLHPGDLVTVLDAMTFSPEAVTKVTKRPLRVDGAF